MESLPPDLFRAITLFLADPKDYFNLRAVSYEVMYLLPERIALSAERLAKLVSQRTCPNMITNYVSVVPSSRVDSQIMKIILNCLTHPHWEKVRCYGRCGIGVSGLEYISVLYDEVESYLTQTHPQNISTEIRHDILEGYLVLACDSGKSPLVSAVSAALPWINMDLFIKCVSLIRKWNDRKMRKDFVANLFQKSSRSNMTGSDLDCLVQACPTTVRFLATCGVPFDNIPLRLLLLSETYDPSASWLRTVLKFHPEWQTELRLDSEFTLWAARNDDPARLKVLVSAGAAIDPVLCLFSTESVSVIKYLSMQFGLDINMRYQGRCLLVRAVEDFHNESFLSKLLRLGIEVSGLNGYEAMLASAQDDALLKRLIAHGAEINAAYNGRGETVLHRACGGWVVIDAVELLLKKCANVNAVDKVGNTALMHAAATGRADLVNLLLSRGAVKDLVNFDGETALSIAEERGMKAAVALLSDTKRRRYGM